MSVRTETKNKPHSILEVINALAFIGIVLFICTALFYALNVGKWTMFIDLLLDFLIMAASIILCINIHEFGHFVFGKLSGYQLISYAIGFFTWANENGNMKLSVRKNKGFAGLCSMSPPEQSLPNYNHCLFYAGGIIFNMLSAVILAVPFAFITSTSDKMNLFFIVFILCSMILGLLNFLPFVSGNNPSDGKLLYSFLLKKPYAEKLTGINEISAQLSKGCRPGELKIPLPPDLNKPGAFDMMLLLCQYFKSLDSHNKLSAISFANLLESNIHAFSHHSLPTVYYELCFVGCITNDETKAKYYYALASKSLKNNKNMNAMRIKAYYEYFINKNNQAALSCCENALSVADKFPVKGQAVMETELVEGLKAMLIM